MLQFGSHAGGNVSEEHVETLGVCGDKARLTLSLSGYSGVSYSNTNMAAYQRLISHIWIIHGKEYFGVVGV